MGKSQDLTESWRRLSQFHGTIDTALDNRLRRDFRVSLTEFAVLDALEQSPEGNLRMQELASVAALTQSALSRLVTRLESDNFVERVICEDDRRGRYIGITGRGREFVETLCPVFEQTLALALAQALRSEDIHLLADDLIEATTRAMESIGAEGGGEKHSPDRVTTFAPSSAGNGRAREQRSSAQKPPSSSKSVSV
jgi:DNA-binding MarR family transcriptional regulator